MKTLYSLLLFLAFVIGSFNQGSAQATLTLPADVPAAPGNAVTVPVNAKGINNMVGFQFTIEYDKDKLTYVNISNWASGITGVTVSTPQEGKITFVYADPNLKINISDGKFFDINFTAKNGTSGSATLAWSDNPTAKSLINYDLDEINSNYVNGSVKIQSSCVAPAAPVVGTITHPSCSVSTGSVVLSGLPATGTWTITRTPGNITSTGTGTSKTITGLEAGTYSFTVTNAEGCASALSANVVVNQPALPSPPVVGNISTNSVTLNGLPSSGTWTITRTPGNINYSGSGTSFNVTPLNPGSYTFTVTNSSGCTSLPSASAVIGTQPASLTIGSMDASPGSSVSVAVNAKGISNLVGFQFTIDYDKDKLTYVNISNWATGITGVTVSTPQEGKITFVYADPNFNINIADGKIFDISFIVKENTSGNAALIWSDNPTERQLVNSNLDDITSNYINGNITLGGPCNLSITPESLYFPSIKENQIITVIFDSPWSISDTSSWLATFPNSGTGNKVEIITVSVLENTGGIRNGFLTISGCNSYKIIPITQSGVVFSPAINKDSDATNELKIYPNPFSNSILIDNHEKVTRMKIINVLGQTVIDAENPGHFTNTEKLIDGVYFITLFGKDDVLKSVKMIKNSR
jgi:hypothetical protein